MLDQAILSSPDFLNREQKFQVFMESVTFPFLHSDQIPQPAVVDYAVSPVDTLFENQTVQVQEFESRKMVITNEHTIQHKLLIIVKSTVFYIVLIN